MANSRKVAKVFLASPGDLGDERKAAKSVIDEFNDLLAEEFGYQVELVGWEDTVSVFGRPQATINRELERCELFVGLMWKHWGTPPDVAGTYTSGFEEEYHIAVDRRLREEQPEISLLFKEIDSEYLKDPGDQLQKVLAFKHKLIAEKNIYFENFADIRDFERKFRRCITTYIRNLKAQEEGESATQNQLPTNGIEPHKTAKTPASEQETPFSTEGAGFLRKLISSTERKKEKEPLSAAEIARFRLLANIIGGEENDAHSVGVHDANLLFVHSDEFTFGRRELLGLLRSGLEHYAHENTPIWRWYEAIDGFSTSPLPFFTTVGSVEMRIGALAAMRLISEPLPSEPPFDRKDFLDNWFRKDTATALKVAALEYLGDCGITSDLMIIREQFNGNNNQIINAAADAIILIKLRDGCENAINALYELQPTFINRKVLGKLFDKIASLSAETLLVGVDHQNSDVRRLVVEALRIRKALPKEIAEKLINDSDAAIRYEALKSLMDAGYTYSDEETKNILIKQPRNMGFGLLSGSDNQGEECWEHLRRKRLQSLSDNDLELAAAKDPIFERDAQFILAERNFSRYRESLRKSVDDEYSADFLRAFHAMANTLGERSDLLEKMRSIEDHIRKELTRQGLDVICQKADPVDLGRVRTAMKKGFIDISIVDIEYIRKNGEWEDISLVIDCVKRPEYGRGLTLLSASDNSKYVVAAHAIYELGRTRLAEVIAMPAPSQLITSLIVNIPIKSFGNLGDESIIPLLRSEDDSVRRTVALKCVRALAKRRVSKLLADYVSDDQQHYYDVIHWLDFGISTPKDRAVLAAKKVLNKEWRI